MARIQLGINVADIDEAVAFYTKLFGVEPAKREPGYANFAVADPPLKLVLFEAGDAAPGAPLNHLGVEVETTDAVESTQRRLESEGLSLAEERGTTCCYAVQDKVWATAPDGLAWEVYTVLEDAPASDVADDTGDAVAACGPAGCG